MDSSNMNPTVEIPILLFIIIFGVIGNGFIVGAVLVEKQLRSMGVALIINLAVADLVITAWYLPQVLANIFNGYSNSLANAWWFCYITGFMVSWCCQVSMLTLMFIAFWRYIKLTKNSLYRKWFDERLTLLTIAFIWVESFLVALPLIVGWGDSGTLLGFDEEIVSCMWNDKKAPGYNTFLVVFAIFIPLFITASCYLLIYRHVKRTRLPPRREISPSTYGRDNMQVSVNGESELSSTTMDNPAIIRTHHARHNSINSHKVARSRRQEERERNLVVALAVVVLFFVVFWTPYAVAVLLSNTVEIPVLAKRACGWLALSNSAINGFIYGALNQNFRRGYVTMCKLICAPFAWCLCSRNNRHLQKSCLRSCRSGKQLTQSDAQDYRHHSVTFN